MMTDLLRRAQEIIVMAVIVLVLLACVGMSEGALVYEWLLP